MGIENSNRPVEAKEALKKPSLGQQLAQTYKELETAKYEHYRTRRDSKVLPEYGEFPLQKVTEKIQHNSKLEKQEAKIDALAKQYAKIQAKVEKEGGAKAKEFLKTIQDLENTQEERSKAYSSIKYLGNHNEIKIGDIHANVKLEKSIKKLDERISKLRSKIEEISFDIESGIESKEESGEVKKLRDELAKVNKDFAAKKTKFEQAIKQLDLNKLGQAYGFNIDDKTVDLGTIQEGVKLEEECNRLQPEYKKLLAEKQRLEQEIKQSKEK